MFKIQMRLALVLTLLFFCASLGAQTPEPLGDQFQINTTTAFYQWQSDIGGFEDGFVVVWSGPGSFSYDIFAQRFTSGGDSVGGEFEVNSFTSSWQYAPAVAVASNGEFIVVWQSGDSAGSDSDEGSIQGRRFDSAGNPRGADFQVNTHTPETQSAPDVALDPQGGFRVVWTSWSTTGTDNHGTNIQSRRFGSDGVGLGDDFQVNTYTTNYQASPSIAIGPDGGAVIVWGDVDIRGRHFDSVGDPGSEWVANTYTVFDQEDPAVAINDVGDFMVTWMSYKNSPGTDQDQWSIQSRRFQSDGSALDQFQVNEYTTGSQQNPEVAVADGDFMVVWYGQTPGFDVFGRRIATNGAPTGEDIRVSTYVANRQWSPRITGVGSEFVVSWDSYGSPGDDSSWYSVQGQRFNPRPEVFEDGFESGDVSAWSGSVF